MNRYLTRPGDRKRAAERGSPLAGKRRVAGKALLTDEQAAEHERRIAAETIRVQAEMRGLGIRREDLCKGQQ